MIEATFNMAVRKAVDMPRPPAYATPRLAVDIVILTIRADQLHVLLIQRAGRTFTDMLALPGGFVAEGEALDVAALRELHEETHIDGARLHLEQVRTYGAPDRDPRGRVVSVAYLGIAPDLPQPRGGGAARAASWCLVDDVLTGAVPLAFDHREITTDAVERARGKLEYTSLATAFCSVPFTIADLRRVYEAVWGIPVDPRNFSRKVKGTEGFLVPTGARRQADTGRPPALYRRGKAVTLFPPMLRSRLVDGAVPGPRTAE
jgi:8-oxo-dGTP diphosphatase